MTRIGPRGPLISIALVREDGESIYIVYQDKAKDPWVQANVLPILWSIPSPLPGMAYLEPHGGDGPHRLAHFLKDDPRPYIVTDWPDDVAYFCRAIMLEPGKMAAIPSLRFEVVRVDAYPTDVPGAADGLRVAPNSSLLPSSPNR